MMDVAPFGPQLAPDGGAPSDVERVHESVTHLMLRGSLLPVGAGVAVTLLMVAMLWNVADHRLLLGWCGVKLTLAAARLAHLLMATDRHGLRQSAVTARRTYLGLLAPDCLMWGLPAVLFAPMDSPTGLLMLCVAVGVAAIAVRASLGDAVTGSTYVAGMLGPAIAVHLLAATRDSAIVATGLMLYAAVLIADARRIGRRYVEQVQLRIDHERVAAERHRAMLLAEHSSAAKSRFLAAVSHEMRTPLNGVLGMAELLQRSPLRPEQRVQVQVIRKSAQHLQTVIGDLLDLSRVEFGKLVIEHDAFDLEETVREVTDLLRPVARDKGIALSVAFAPAPLRTVVGDASRVKQVLHNLVGNAIKFTDEGKVAVTVQTETSGADAALLRLTVRDTGRGIGDDEARHLFDAFAQGAASDRRSGTGLGLTIARQLARAMGGDVTYQAREPRGSKFVFTARVGLPAPTPVVAADAEARSRAVADGNAADESAADYGPPTSPGGESALLGRVLVADDNPVNAMVASSMLQRFGLVVDVAEDGEQALEMMSAQPYDAVLMDCQMPRLDGFEATRRWRERERSCGTPHLPIVALTANAVVGDRERCLEAGMDDYLTKPFEMHQLRGLVKNWLAR